MRQPVLFDKSLIDRNLSLYAKRFNQVAIERLAWLDENFKQIEDLRYIDISFRLVEPLTEANVVRIGGYGPYPTHMMATPKWTEEALEALKQRVSFRLYKCTNNRTFELLKRLGATIHSQGSNRRVKYSIVDAQHTHAQVIFSQMNFALAMFRQDEGVSFGHRHVINRNGDMFDDHTSLRYMPDTAFFTPMNKGVTSDRVAQQMHYIIKEQMPELVCGISNDFMASMVDRFIELHNDPYK